MPPKGTGSLAKALVLVLALVATAEARTVKLAPSKKPATVKTQAEIAEKRNWDGAQAYRKKAYPSSTQAFREAVARVPEARYFFNLCASLYQEGTFSEALTACGAVGRNNPTTALQKQADQLIVWINEDAKAEGRKLEITPAP